MMNRFEYLKELAVIESRQHNLQRMLLESRETERNKSMGIVGDFKEVAATVQQISNIELYQIILDLQGEALSSPRSCWRVLNEIINSPGRAFFDGS